VVTITGKLKNGALAYEHHSGVATDKSTTGARLTIWGLSGTLRYAFGDSVELARPGEALAVVDVPANLRRDWCVEQDFISAVENARQNKPWKVSPDFDEGLLYMQKVEAVHASAKSGRSVRLAEL
jgi:predicted dehydrogenase